MVASFGQSATDAASPEGAVPDGASGDDARRELRRPRRPRHPGGPRRAAHLAALALTVAFALPTALAPAAARAGDLRSRHGPPPLRTVVIGPAQEARVMALIAPWQEGDQIAAGWRLEGAAIEQARACYLFAGARSARVCLVAPDVAEAASAGRRWRAVHEGVRVVWADEGADERAGDGAAAAADALLDAVAGRVAANANSAGLLALWRRVDRVGASREGPNLDALLGWLAALLAWLVVAAPLALRGGLAVRGAYALGLVALLLRLLQLLEGFVALPHATDLLLWLPLLLAWIVWTAARSVADTPARGWALTLGVLAISAFTRLTLPVAAPMTAWSYTRTSRLGTFADESTLLRAVCDALGGVAFDDLQSWLMRLVSIFTPIAVLGHGRKLFGDARPAAAAALLLACSPHHLRFSAADVQFIPSMLWSSAAFLWLYELLEARAMTQRALLLALFVPLLWISLTARPLNLAYAPLMLLALAMAAQMATPRWRAAIALVIAAVAAAVTYELLTASGDVVGSVLTPAAIAGAFELLVDPELNPLLFWRLTPPAWLLLIAAGALALVLGPWQSLPARTARLRGLWLLGWLFGYIALHGVVVVEEPMNNARYQLHSLPAMALLAGAGWWALATRWRGGAGGKALVAALSALLLAAPWLHREAIADVDFVTMRERAFLREALALAPAGCTAIEVDLGRDADPSPRIERVMARVGGSEPTPRWRVQSVIGQQDAVDALLAAPPACLLFIEGVSCAAGPGKAGRQPICAAILASGRWAMLSERRFVARVYDYGLTAPFRANGDEVVLRLWRRDYDPDSPPRGARR